jgi:hypothetical protein
MLASYVEAHADEADSGSPRGWIGTSGVDD